MGYSESKDNLRKLIAKFERELVADNIKDYNEEAAKTAFIQPFLKDVLDWDVTNRDEVSPEENISRGRVDYGLKVDGNIRIFVEAKPPRSDLSKHLDQAIRYGYNRRGVPFVLLTNFEEMMLFDVTIKPDDRNPLKGLKLHFKYDQYIQRFKEIWQISREAVVNGKLDDLLKIKPKDRIPVDKAILDDLKSWRESLAKDIYKNNPSFFHSEQHEKDAVFLKEIVQKILDRIIFMRSCEDRGLIHRHHLKELFEERTDAIGTKTMVFLGDEFKYYNIIFDSDLFRPQDWEAAILIDFKVMKRIVLDTYNPYLFDVISIEVLGNIYEQYLGYTIRLTDQQIRYELKPEVRKAGGIYYTPAFIVNYIVTNTVGKRLKEASSKKPLKLRILDPACGSGSFLIRAYEEILIFYSEKKKTSFDKTGKLLPNEEEETRLSIYEKSLILKEHIFGVDIDEQAVEVTKLSLMLKMLEGEMGIVPGRAILPMLDKNIKCGNSLISGTTLELKEYFGENWMNESCFNWENEYRTILAKEKGFDIVIGNPPWGSIFSKNELAYFRSTYITAQGELDSYSLFIERSINLLKKNGGYGVILPDTWLTLINSSKLRKWILESVALQEIAALNEFVFEQATVDPLILLLIKTKPPIRHKTKVMLFPKNKVLTAISGPESESLHKQADWIDGNSCQIKIYSSSDYKSILTKIIGKGPRLGELITYKAGCKPYEIGKGTPPQTASIVSNKPFTAFTQTEKIWKPLIRGNDLKRYSLSKKKPEWIKYGKWLAAPRDYSIFSGPRLLIQAIRNPSLNRRIIATYVTDEYIARINVYTLILNEISTIGYFYLLGILNSSLMNWFLMKDYGLHTYVITGVLQIPIKIIDFNNKQENEYHKKISSLVQCMLDQNNALMLAKGNEKNRIQAQIIKTDQEIDELIYTLYGLSNNERKLFEK